MTQLLIHHGLPLLFAVVALEMVGVPIPGETALIAAGILASRGDYSIVTVIAVAAAAAYLGGIAGYWLGRRGGRKLLQRWSLLERLAERTLPPGERFFERHGAKTVLLARFFPFLRVTAFWVAGIGRMRWWPFAGWSLVGAIAWAAAVGIVADVFGRAAASAISHYGLIGIAALVALALVAAGGMYFWNRGMAES